MDDRPSSHAALLQRAREAAGGSQGPAERLQTICRLLRDGLEGYDWVGFYLVDPAADRSLVLGPYEGEPTEHTRIPFGRGICGQAAERGETVVVDDVSQESNYLACSTAVQSEIVVPVYHGGSLVGELDIDSHLRPLGCRPRRPGVRLPQRNKWFARVVCIMVAGRSVCGSFTA